MFKHLFYFESNFSQCPANDWWQVEMGLEVGT